jgi:hypothetical protein
LTGGDPAAYGGRVTSRGRGRVRRVAVLAALATALAGGAGGAPAGLAPAIDGVARGARVADRADVDAESCNLEGVAEPGLVRGDFDGDGRADYAALLRLGDEGWFVVFLARPSGGFAPVIISRFTAAGRIARQLEFQPPGRVDGVEPDGEHVVLTHPGVTEIYCGQAASTYYWDAAAKTFRYIVTGD